MELNFITNHAKVQFPFEEKELQFSANRAKVQSTLLGEGVQLNSLR